MADNEMEKLTKQRIITVEYYDNSYSPFLGLRKQRRLILLRSRFTLHCFKMAANKRLKPKQTL